MRRTTCCGLLLALAFAPPASAEEPADAPVDPPADFDEDWMIRCARMEGASVDVEEAAAELHATATRISSAHRLSALSELVSDASELNRQVVSARLAASVFEDTGEESAAKER